MPWNLTDYTRYHQIECCIDEWSTGTRKQSSWKEGRYKTNYFSHLNSLRDLESHGQQGRDVLRQIQNELLKAARYVSLCMSLTLFLTPSSEMEMKHARGCPSRSSQWYNGVRKALLRCTRRCRSRRPSRVRSSPSNKVPMPVVTAYRPCDLWIVIYCSTVAPRH